MIHVDVNRNRDTDDVRVQTSVDGSDWLTQYTISRKRLAPGTLESDNDQQQRAIDTARIFAHGMAFVGARTRMTAFGNELDSLGNPVSTLRRACTCPMSVREAMGGMSSVQDGPHHSVGCPKYVIADLGTV